MAQFDTLFTKNNLKKPVIQELHDIIESNPGTNYVPVRAFLDSNTKLRRIIIERYKSPDEDKWREQYHTAIYSIIEMVQGSGELDDLE